MNIKKLQRKIAVALIICISLLIVGCNNSQDELEVTYRIVQSEYSRLTKSGDLNAYVNYCLFLISSESYDIDYLEGTAKEDYPLISDYLFNKLLERSDGQQGKNSRETDSNEDEDVVSEEDIIGDSTYKEYPIYGTHFEILRYGTKEESEASIKAFQERPLNTVHEVTEYRDRLAFKVDNKYNGEQLVVLYLVGNEVIRYEEFR